jgi:hypothetical protein
MKTTYASKKVCKCKTHGGSLLAQGDKYRTHSKLFCA